MLMPRGAARRAALALSGITLLTTSGCGVAQHGSVDRGRQLFTSKCATCHSLKDAGSTAQIGPNLDAAFAQARAAGEDSDTIASVAGAPGIKGPQLPNDPGAPVFANNGCSGCHTLKAVGASGTTGPSLDEVIPGMSAAEVKKSIVDPNAKITKGYPSGVMPQTFGQVISPQDL